MRHDPRWAALGCNTPRIREVIEPLMGDDFTVVYTDGAVRKADPYTDGALRKADPYTDGALVGKADPFTDGQ